MRHLLLALAFLASTAFGQVDEQQIDRLFATYDGQVPGASVLVVKSGEVVFAKGYGLANTEESEPATELTNYRLASVSKAFTAMAIMILQERGQLSYDDSIVEHLARFPRYGESITIRHLLGHTSGFADYENHIPANQTEQLTDRDVVDILRSRSGTYFTPGSQYRYSNSGYATLAVIVENVSGMTFSDFLSENIFSPLGMNDTVAYVNGIHEVSHRAYGYTQSGRRFRRTDQSITSAVLGDGGVYTSAIDYAKWDTALYDESLVSATTLDEAFSSGVTSNGQRTGYGFGWKLDTYRGERRISHTGSTIGFRTAVQRFPEKNLSILVLINRAGSAPWNIAEDIADMFFN